MAASEGPVKKMQEATWRIHKWAYGRAEPPTTASAGVGDDTLGELTRDFSAGVSALLQIAQTTAQRNAVRAALLTVLATPPPPSDAEATTAATATAVASENSSATAAATTTVLAPAMGPRRKRACKAQQLGMRCAVCGATETSEWRRGPDDRKSLCNACGLRYSKMLRKELARPVSQGPGTRVPVASLLNL